MLIVIIILIGAFLFSMVSCITSGSRIGYEAESQITTVTGEEKRQDMYEYRDDVIGYSIWIPDTWKQVSDEDTSFFMNVGSTATVKLNWEEYTPTINTVTEEQVRTQLDIKGLDFVSFEMLSDTVYELCYMERDSNINNYVEDIFWSCKYIVHVTCIYEDSEKQEVLDQIVNILDSFTWHTQDIIPNGYRMIYSDTGSFEVGVPSNWTVDQTSNYINAVDLDTGCGLAAFVMEYDGDIRSVSMEEWQENLHQIQEEYVLENFSAVENEVTATISYLINGNKKKMDIRVIANGIFLYQLVLEYPDGMMDDATKNTINGLFREYVTVS